MKKMKKGIVLVMALALALSLALPIPALAQGKTPFTAQIVDLTGDNPGTSTYSQLGNLLVVKTTGEVNQAQVVGSGVGLDGTVIETHHSVITINLVNGAINGLFKGTVVLNRSLTGDTVPGTIEGVVTGYALFQEDGSIWTEITDYGVLELPSLKVRGTFTIWAAGTIGVDLSGGGVLRGVIGG